MLIPTNRSLDQQSEVCTCQSGIRLHSCNILLSCNTLPSLPSGSQTYLVVFGHNNNVKMHAQPQTSPDITQYVEGSMAVMTSHPYSSDIRSVSVLSSQYQTERLQ